MKKPEVEIRKKNLWYIDDQIKNQLESISFQKVIFSRWNIFKSIIQNQLKEKKNIRVLDAGVGDGINLIGMKNILEETTISFKIFACDYNDIRLQRSKKFKFVKEFKKTDLKKTGYKSNMFDIILCNHVLEHIPNIDKALSELKRILKPQGILILNVPNEGCFMANLRNKFFQKKMFESTDHVHFFTRKKFSKVLYNNKIKILKWYRIGFFFPFLPFQILIRKYVIGRLIEKLLGLIFSSQSTDLIVSTTK